MCLLGDREVTRLLFIHTTWLEIVFLIASTTAVLLVLFSVLDAQAGVNWVVSQQGSAQMRLVAQQIVRQEMFRLAKASLLFLSAILANFLAPPPPSYTTLPQTFITITAMALVSSLLAIESILDKISRNRLRREREKAMIFSRRATDPLPQEGSQS